MSFLGSIILSTLEKELTAMEPQIAQFLLAQVKTVSAELIEYVDGKLGIAPDSVPAENP